MRFLRLLTAAALLAPLSPAQSGYKVVDLGTLGSPTSIAYAVNDQGVVAGDDGGGQAFVWKNQRMEALPNPGGYSRALGINNHGDVVGIWSDTKIHAVLWTSGGAIRQLDSIIGSQAWARAINDDGEIVGQFLTSTGAWNAYLIDKRGRFIDLGRRVGPSDARAINNEGQVLGSFVTPDRRWVAFRWDEGEVVELESPANFGGVELGGINNRGQIAFSLSPLPAPNLHAFLWEKGHLIDLGNFGGVHTTANAINQDGRIAGAYTTSDHTYAYLWEKAKVAVLPSLGGMHSGAWAINDRGEAAGWSNQSNGLWHAVLWKPLKGRDDEEHDRPDRH